METKKERAFIFEGTDDAVKDIYRSCGTSAIESVAGGPGFLCSGLVSGLLSVSLARNRGKGDLGSKPGLGTGARSWRKLVLPVWQDRLSNSVQIYGSVEGYEVPTSLPAQES
jgi:hypothetical protein